MRSTRTRVLLLATALLLALTAAVTAARAPGRGDGDRKARQTATGAFPPLERDDVNALLTPSGIVAPVVGRARAGALVLTPCANTVLAGGAPLSGAHVVLDPGHGGSETGATGPAGLVEKDVNLDVAQRAAELLKASGAAVVLTRDTDVRMTIETRAAIATALDPLVFLSVHHNAGPIATAGRPGSEVYFTESSADARRFAGLLWEELQAHLAPFGDEWAQGEVPGVRARLSSAGTDFYGVLRRPVDVPSVLSEAVFLSDADEERLLRDGHFLHAEATAIRDALVRFVTSAEPGSGFRETLVSDTPAGPGGGREGCVDPPLS